MIFIMYSVIINEKLMIKYINKIKQSMGLSAKESFNQNKENPPKPDFIYYITFPRNGLCSHCFLSGLLDTIHNNIYVLRVKDLSGRGRLIFYKKLYSNASIEQNNIEEKEWVFEIVDSAIRIHGCSSWSEAEFVVSFLAKYLRRKLILKVKNITKDSVFWLDYNRKGEMEKTRF
jgi:hypothetical protein